MLSSKSAANDDGEDDDNGEDDDDNIFPKRISNVKSNAARTTASAPKIVKKSQKVESEEEGEEAVFAYVFLFWCLYSVLIIFSPKSVQAAKKASALACKIAKKNQKVDSEDEVEDAQFRPLRRLLLLLARLPRTERSIPKTKVMMMEPFQTTKKASDPARKT
ncbi:hypothetical protein BDN70DRAFT_940069 [Pholiota conissans]|uniref:Uncharacterized protein n=1 Tax=Pholiota conissans TaxID=109636 RepID=A0A9P5YK66_9AGAR|nr:hypothetical protein BDN70DRAFT_940069 [Pholiota conissans]